MEGRCEHDKLPGQCDKCREPELECCPFCGLNDPLYHAKKDIYYCANCGSEGPADSDAWDGILTADERWNKRTGTTGDSANVDL